MNSIERNKTYYIQNQFKTLEDTFKGRIGKHLHEPAQPSVNVVPYERNVTSPCRSATSLSFCKERDVLAKPKQGEVKIKPLMM